MRPTYETKKDIGNEAKVAQLFGERFDCEMHKADRFKPYDYMAKSEGGVRGVVEIKCRSNSMLTYPTYMISSRKINKLQKLEVPAILLVRWTDRVGYINVNNLVHTSGAGGRTDRGDSLDIEECMYIPIHDFTVWR